MNLLAYGFLIILLSGPNCAKGEVPPTSISISTEDKVRTLVPETFKGKVKSPAWKMNRKKFDTAKKAFLALPNSVDSISDCPHRYIKVELRTDGNTKRKFSCLDSRKEQRRSFVQFFNDYG